MFKSLVFVVFASCVLVVLSKPMSKEEQAILFQKLMGECKASEGATDDDLKIYVTREVPSNKIEACLVACMLTNFGIMKDGAFNIEGSTEIGRSNSMGDAAKFALVEEILVECGGVTGADRCETAHNIVECTQKAAVARNLDPKNII